MLSIVGGYVLGKAGDAMADRFTKAVIGRWTKHRADNFVRSFLAAVAANRPKDDIDKLLDEIMASESKTEALFDAYRAVSLSKSKTTGPRAIGFLTALIVLEDRHATEAEESWFEVFSQAYDHELDSIANFYAESFQFASDPAKTDYVFKHSELILKWSEDTTNVEARGAQDRTPLDVGEFLGKWARLLRERNILRTRMTEESRDYDEDGERGVDQPGTEVTVTHWIVLDQSDKRYADLISASRDLDPPSASSAT